MIFFYKLGLLSFTMYSSRSDKECVTYNFNFLSEDEKYKSFLILIVMFLIIKFLLKIAIDDIPEKALLVKKRHANMIEKVISNFNN